MHMTEKCMTPFSSDCLRMNSTIILMVMNHGAEAHSTMYMVAFRYFRTKIKNVILQFWNPASRQSCEIANTATVVIFEDTKHIVVGLFNSPTTITEWNIPQQRNKIASSKRKLGCASAMLFLQRIASLNDVFVVEDEQVTGEADMLMWI